MKKFFYIIILSIFFSFLIFYIKNYFFGDIKEDIIRQIEENYIEPTYDYENTNSGITQEEKEKILAVFNSAKEVNYTYVPEIFEQECRDYSQNLKDFFGVNKIKNKINNLNVELNKEIYDTRGKMKDRTIKLFGISNIPNEEFLSVAIHEFGHYIDLYYLEKKVLKDISNYFYNISWESTKTIKAGLEQEDFVSGYAMTNKYEDFAESFTYYILHNKDFLEKTKKSNILLEKYNFFEKNLFIFEEFKNTDFSNNIIKNYYRDITKIDYNIKNFLQYLENLL